MLAEGVKCCMAEGRAAVLEMGVAFPLPQSPDLGSLTQLPTAQLSPGLFKPTNMYTIKCKHDTLK